jgi:hypothetical protein
MSGDSQTKDGKVMSKWITLRVELNTASADDVVDEINSAILCKLEEDEKIISWEWSELDGE